MARLRSQGVYAGEGVVRVSKPIVALALVTQEELASLGPLFSRAYPVDEVPCFGELLHAIDLADRQIWQERDRVIASPQDAPIINSADR